RVFATFVGIAGGPAIVDLHVSAVGPTQLLQRLLERSDVGLRAWIARVVAALKHADTPHSLGLLRTRHHRPRCCPGKPRDELAPSHSITSSARASSEGGMVSPSALAVLRLITNSNFVACRIGKSAGLVPCRIRAVYMPA